MKKNKRVAFFLGTIALLAATKADAASSTIFKEDKVIPKNLIAQQAPQILLPRAIPASVGEVSASSLDASTPQFALDSNLRVNLVLSNASAKTALQSLAKSARLNIAFYEDSESAKQSEGKVSIDLQDEPIQSAFNYILRLGNLEASKVGNTIFIGSKLPDSLRETVAKTLRLNQASAAAAATYLASQGADKGSSSGESAAAAAPAAAPAASISKGLLKGLSVSVDDRLNTIMLVGSPYKVKLAEIMLTKLDARRKQVALNVKIVDVNLSNNDSFSSSLSFKAGDGFLSIDRGAAVYNYGGSNPATNAQTLGSNTTPPLIPLAPGLEKFYTIPSKLLSTLQAQIINGNAKILTDPTLVVQEGQKSNVDLTQDVFGGFELTSVAGAGSTTSTRKPIILKGKDGAGLTLEILVNRIDDNGFVSVVVSPTVNSIGNTITTSDGEISLLQSRKLNSGEIRLRDGQTLILSGIIQQSERNSISKVPILGDIPILGALFRSTNKTNQRQEVVVLLTPQVLSDTQGQVNYTPGVDARLMIGK